MQTLPEHIASYKERSWQVHEIPLDGDQPALDERSAPLWCNSNTAMAERIADDPNRLYVDLELLAAGCDPSAGGQVGRLAADWNGHAAGQLVILTFEKIRNGLLVILVENS